MYMEVYRGWSQFGHNLTRRYFTLMMKLTAAFLGRDSSPAFTRDFVFYLIAPKRIAFSVEVSAGPVSAALTQIILPLET